MSFVLLSPGAMSARQGCVMRSGEPALLGLDYFRKIVALQCRHKPPSLSITNCIHTNGTLIDEEWCRFLAEKGFVVGLSMDGPQDTHDRYRLTRGRKPTHRQAMLRYKSSCAGTESRAIFSVW